MKCSICSKQIKSDSNGWDKGHNAQPINDGRCCTKCNNEIVIPYRISLMMRKHKRVEQE